jgi:hypothetical protein
MIKNFEKLIKDIEKGNETDAYEAAKKIAFNKLSNGELKKLANIVQNGVVIHNKEAATYAISFSENGTSALAILIDILSNSENHERVRGQAAEGIGLVLEYRRSKLRTAAEEILLKSLKDPSPTIRFWSCYAVGSLKMKNAIPILKELQANDHAVCPGWWYISEEAEDAIEWINGRPGKERICVNHRNN